MSSLFAGRGGPPKPIAGVAEAEAVRSVLTASSPRLTPLPSAATVPSPAMCRKYTAGLS
jgi:hypothetical protein